MFDASCRLGGRTRTTFVAFVFTLCFLFGEELLELRARARYEFDEGRRRVADTFVGAVKEAAPVQSEAASAPEHPAAAVQVETPESVTSNGGEDGNGFHSAVSDSIAEEHQGAHVTHIVESLRQPSGPTPPPRPPLLPPPPSTPPPPDPPLPPVASPPYRKPDPGTLGERISDEHGFGGDDIGVAWPKCLHGYASASTPGRCVCAHGWGGDTCEVDAVPSCGGDASIQDGNRYYTCTNVVLGRMIRPPSCACYAECRAHLLEYLSEKELADKTIRRVVGPVLIHFDMDGMCCSFAFLFPTTLKTENSCATKVCTRGTRGSV